MYLSDFDQAILDSVTPSDLGPVFTEYRNDPEGAIKRLLVEQTGDAKAVWSRPEIGSIDLIWGGERFGLKKIARKHPEAIAKLPRMLKSARLVQGQGPNKMYLIEDGEPSHITVISLNYMGSAKAWVVTSYDDHKGEASGILASVDTKKLDSAKMDCRSTVPMLVEILGHDMNSVNIFDNAAPLSALERLKLVKRLLELRNEANGLGKGGVAAMRKLKIVREMIDIRNRLGLGGSSTTPEPQATGTVQPTEADGTQATTPEPKPEEQNPHVKALQDLAAGKNDGQGLEGMFNIILGAIDALEAVNPLTGDNEAAAHAAITHWAEFEERLNG